MKAFWGRQQIHEFKELLEHKFFADLETYCVLTRSFPTEVLELKSNQKEAADTRPVLHANNVCNSGIPNVLVVSEDIDVITLV